MSETLLSVGLDVGTTTTQLVVSRLQVENRASSFAVPELEITDREVIYRSPVHFTPLIGQALVDGEGVRRLLEAEYQKAGITPSQVDTGAVIITGETSRKENARAVLDALSEVAGDFVVATAGPDLESVLAAKGAGAVEYSQKTGKTVLHMDIGGGTSNLALMEKGRIVATGCMNVGGRLLKFEDGGKVSYVSPVLRGLTDLQVGAYPAPGQVEGIARILVRGLEMAAGLRPATELLEKLWTQESGDRIPSPGAASLPAACGGVKGKRSVCRGRQVTQAFAPRKLPGTANGVSEGREWNAGRQDEVPVFARTFKYSPAFLIRQKSEIFATYPEQVCLPLASIGIFDSLRGAPPPGEGMKHEDVVISFSGGVADCIETRQQSGAFGDMGAELGQAIRESLLCRGEYMLGSQTIRATVIGAGCHSAQLSGSTVFCRGVDLPLKNLPVEVFSQQEQDSTELPALIRQRRLQSDSPQLVLAMPGHLPGGYAALTELAKRIVQGAAGGPVLVCLEADMAKALGQKLCLLLPEGTPCLCIDRVRLTEDSFLDVGSPVGPAFPVVVKTLVLQND